MRLMVLCALIFVAGSTFGQQHVESRIARWTIKDLPVDSKAFHFLIVGDWGRNGQGDQQKVADWMGVAANQVNAKFVVSTGDNFYCCGVASTNDYQWISSFENVFRSHALQIPWYVVLGNHDYQGNVNAQIDYTHVSQRWKMPARYFTKNIRGVRFVFIDTSPFISSYYKSDQFPDLQKQDTTRQLAWMDSVLLHSREKWKIVVGHHPVYSVGEHGGEPDMQRMVLKRMVKNKVQLYLAGHDHSLQSLAKTDEPTRHLISGGGAEVTPIISDPQLTRFAKSTTGFMVAAVTDNNIKIYFINNSGKILYTELLEGGQNHGQ